MKIYLRNIAAVLVGFVAGNLANMGIIGISASVIAPPAGTQTDTIEGLKAAILLFETKHFIFPFLAHALGTLVGAAVAAAIAASRKFELAMVLGALFLLGGITAVMMLPAPMWFNVLDLVVAYLPMAWLGWWLVARPKAA